MNSFEYAKEYFGENGIDVEHVFRRLDTIAISLHCWQGDDVAGFEGAGTLDGGLAVTGNYPGKARNPEELRGDLKQALSLIPGPNRLNLHAIYAEQTGKKKVDRNRLEPKHFSAWVDWARENGLGLDFNPSYFAHPKATGLTLSHPDAGIREFWVEHGIACRKIAESFGKALNNTCITNFWIPDGYKDTPYDRLAPRKRLEDSLDRIFAVRINEKYNRDAVESKLFGIGAESYTVGSHEFYMGYALKKKKMICLDSGHFHPTEVISDKISSCLLFSDELLLHVSRGVRWDSDHVVTLNDELLAIAQEIVRHEYEKRVHIGLDYFDASINRIAAWTTGARNMRKALLYAMLEPMKELKKAEKKGDDTSRMILMEEAKSAPWGIVWDEYCRRCGTPDGNGCLKAIKQYENNILKQRK